MARHFLRLKLTLLVATCKGSWQRAVGLVAALVVGVPAAVGAAVLLALAGGWEEGGGAVVTLALASLTLGWVVLPPIAFGIDNTLDPARLALLPLERRQLAVGLLVAGAAGVGAVLTTAVVAGAVVGQAAGLFGAVLAVAAGLLQVAVCLVAARAVTTALSARLRSRKGRDVSAVLLALGGLAFAGIGQLPNLLGQALVGLSPDQIAERLNAVAGVVALTPFGWASGAMAAAGAGDWLGAMAGLAAAGGLLVGLSAWWMRTLATSLETTEARAPTAGADVDLVVGPLRVLPRGPLAAMAAKDLRYLWRVPQQRVQWLLLPVFASGMVAASLLVEPLRAPPFVLAVAGAPLLFGLISFNQFGFDRDATWLYVAAAVPGRSAVSAKNLAALMVTAPVTVAVGAALAVITGGFDFLPATLLGALGVFAVTAAVANVTSLLLAQGMPESPTNLWSASGGQGFATSLLQMVAFAVLALLIAPVGALGFVARSSPTGGLLAVAAVGVGWGALFWWLSLRLADTWLATRGPEWVAALRARR